MVAGVQHPDRAIGSDHPDGGHRSRQMRRLAQGVAVETDVLSRMQGLRLHQANGKRSPHKPLLVLLSLGRLVNTGSSAVAWHDAEQTLADLIAEYGPPSRTGRAQSAAYPFTRLRSDGVWVLDHDVAMDNVGPLRAADVTGQLEPALESALLRDRDATYAAARSLVEAHFPDTVARDLLLDVGLDPDLVFAGADVTRALPEPKRRSAAWRLSVLEAWDRQCAFCGFDGLLGGASVGIEAAHVRWFNHEGPDDLDNGLALCSLHHKLFDRGALGLGADHAVIVSTSYSARTDAGRAVYDLHGRRLAPRPGTPLPAHHHVRWHEREVFKGVPLPA